MAEQGQELLSAAMKLAETTRETVDGIDGLRLMGQEVVRPGGAFELDPLVFTIDVRELAITGYQAAEFARAEKHVDLGAADSCRVNARFTHSDNEKTAAVLVDTLRSLVEHCEKLETPPEVKHPSADGLQMETVMLPRDAFFGRVEQVPVDKAVGRVAAEMVTPYPPGVPVLAPGELISQEAIDYLRSGLAAGMLLPDPADPELETIRVVKEDR